MPKVKTVRIAQLSGLTGLAGSAAETIKQGKDLAEKESYSRYLKEQERIDALNKEIRNDYETEIKQFEEAGRIGEGSFDENTAKFFRQKAVERANAQLKQKAGAAYSGDYDYEDLTNEIIKADKQLDLIVKATPQVNALWNKVQDGSQLSRGDVGYVIAEGKTNDVIDIIKKMYSPKENGDIEIVDGPNGETLIRDKNNPSNEISIDALNNMMSGNSPEYPLAFVEDPQEQLKAVNDAAMTRDKGRYYTTSVIGGKTKYTFNEKLYVEDMAKEGSPLDQMFNDPKQFRKFWPNLTKSMSETEIDGLGGYWNGSDEQKKVARQLMAERMAQTLIPQGGIQKINYNYGKSTGNKSDKDKGVDYSKWIKGAYKSSNIGEADPNKADYNKLRGMIMSKLVSINPDEFARHDDPRVQDDIGSDASPTSIYRYNSGRRRWEEYPITQEKLDSNTLNTLLIQNTPN